MDRRYKPKPDSNLMVFALIGVLVTALVGGYLIWRNYLKQPDIVLTRPAVPEKTPTPQKPKVAPTPAEPGQEIDYDRMQNDVDYRDLMATRKEKYGVDESVDMIVKADETVKVGESVIPMREILEKIRLQKKGDMIEKDLGGKYPVDKEAAFEKLKAAETRHAELESTLNIPQSADDPETYQKLTEEYVGLGAMVREYEDYKNRSQSS